MIPAADALLLPSAELTAEEKAAADQLEAEIVAHVKLKMERRGCCDFTTKELRLNVIAEVNQRIKAASWNAQWQQLGEQSKLGPTKMRPIGFSLVLSPTDEAYRAAALRAMS